MIATLAPACPQCQRPTKPVQENNTEAFCAGCRFPLLQVAGKYKLLEELARGGHGVVYKALHMGLTPPQERAIKFIKPARAQDPSVMQRFQREIQVTAALSQTNIHVVRLYDDFGEVPHLGHYYVMEFIEGRTLNEWQERQPAPLPLGLCAHLFLQLCDVMESAHEKKILHRDLKPNNLMLLPQTRGYPLLKVLDFGIAKILRTAQDSAGLTGNAIGTPLYMSPELCLNRPTDERTDIYAMGLLLFELLVGHSPFVRPNISPSQPSPEESFAAHLYQTPPLLSIVCPPKHPRQAALEEVLVKALAKAPAQGYQSVEALRDAFLDALPETELHHKSRYAKTPAALVTPRPSIPVPASPMYDDTPEPTLPPAPIHATPRAPQPESAQPTATLAPAFSPHPPLPTSASQDDQTGASPGPTLPPPKRTPAWIWVLGITLLLGGAFWGYKQRTRPLPSPKKHTHKRTTPHKRALPRSRARANPQPLQRARRPQKRQVSAPKRPEVRRLQPLTQPKPTRRRRALPKVVRARAPKPRSPRPRAPKPRNPHARLVAGCPRQSLFWVRLIMQPTQRHIQPLSKGARITRQPDGYCVGVAAPTGTLVLEKKGFIPCRLPLKKLPSLLKIQLKTEGMLEPSSTSYCRKD